MRKLQYTVIVCKTCNAQEEMCISGMSLSGLCAICRKKQWRKDNPEPKQPPRFCKICLIRVGRNNNSLLCKDCYRKQPDIKAKALENAKVYVKKRKQEDPSFKLSLHLRSRLSHALKEGHHRLKCGSHVLDLGCTIEELKKYLESLFKPGMTWDNWSKDGWHVDHIRPLSSFDLTNPIQFKEACHYSNLQPLWAEENLSKGGTNRLSYKDNFFLEIP